MGSAPALNVPKKREFFWLINIIGLFFMFGFGEIVQPFGPVNEVGVHVIGIILGVIIMSIFTSQMFYVSLVGLAAMVYCGYLTEATACSSFLGSTMVTQLIFITAICGGLQDSGAMKVLAKKLLSSRLLRGRPMVFVIVFLLTCYLVSIFVTYIPAIILMYAMLESIRDVAGYDKKDKFIQCMLLGVYLACMGSFALPFIGIQTVAIAMLRSGLSTFGLAFSDGTYFITNVVVFVVFLLLYTVLIRFVFRCNLEPLRTMDLTNSELLRQTPDKINKRGWIFIVTFLICVVYNLLCNLMPADSPVYSLVFGFGGVWIWVLALAILSVLRVDGERFVVGQDMLKNHTIWNLVCLVGMFSILGSAMTNEEIGIRTWIMDLIGPLFSNVSLPIMVIMVVVIVTLATNVINGLPCTLAAVAVVMPFVAQLALDTGINPSVVGTLISCCANMAYLTYSGSVFSSLILGREEITQKFIWTKGVVTLLVFIVSASVCGIVLSYIT